MLVDSILRKHCAADENDNDGFKKYFFHFILREKNQKT
jgi:hypothetical protein